MKIKDVPKIMGNGEGTEGLTVLRENLYTIIELPCLEACINLYDKNIRTIYSNGNVEDETGIANIGIEYDSLSDENKKIAQELSRQNIIGPIQRYLGHNELIFAITMPMSSESEVSDISEGLNHIASLFVEQDVLYGNTTIEQAQELYRECYHLDMTLEEVISTEISLGKSYDEFEQRIWDNEELLQKHLQFIKRHNRKNKNI